MDMLIDGLIVLFNLLVIFLNFFVGYGFVPSHQIAQLVAIFLRLLIIIGLVGGILT